MAGRAFEPDLTLWDAWHPTEVARRLTGVDATWYVTAGWALDLHHGRADAASTRTSRSPCRRSSSRPFARRSPSSSSGSWEAGSPTPWSAETLATHHQTWVRDPVTGAWRLDVMREAWEGETWVFRRDPRIRLPRERVIAHTEDGIPYARPEIALLFKAKASRPKDDADFASALPLLDRGQREWLAGSIALVHPGHHWLRALAA